MGEENERAWAEAPSAITGLTDGEQRCMDHLLKSLDEFVALDRQHPDEMGTVVDAVHRIQDTLAMRIVRRCFPNYWPTKGGTDAPTTPTPV